MAANRGRFHLHNVEWEELFADDADNNEMPSIRPTTNDHEAGDSGKGVIELYSDKK